MSDVTIKQDIAALEGQIENLSEQLNTLYEQQETQYESILANLNALDERIGEVIDDISALRK